MKPKREARIENINKIKHVVDNPHLYNTPSQTSSNTQTLPPPGPDSSNPFIHYIPPKPNNNS